jgi:hypothetical protein
MAKPKTPAKPSGFTYGPKRPPVPIKQFPIEKVPLPPKRKP